MSFTAMCTGLSFDRLTGPLKVTLDLSASRLGFPGFCCRPRKFFFLSFQVRVEAVCSGL